MCGKLLLIRSVMEACIWRTAGPRFRDIVISMKIDFGIVPTSESP
jgi:hypothetical protein